MRERIYKFLLSFLFTFFIIISYYYTNFGTFSTAFSSLKNLLILIIMSSLLFVFFFLFINYLFKKIDNYKYKEIEENKFDKKIVLITFVLSLTISIIYLIGFYPGIVPWDGLWQLDSAFGIRALNDHHPAILSLFMGLLMNIGRFFLNDNLGVALYIILELTVNALVYSYVLKIFRELKTPKVLKLIAIFFFTCHPLLALNSITYLKDTIYYLLILLYFVYTYYHFRVKQDKNTKVFVLLFLILTLILLYRNTGFYVGLTSLIALFLYTHKKNKIMSRNFLVLLIAFLSLKGSYSIFLGYMHINHAPIREMFSIPLQQTARYMKYYKEDLTEEEYKNLSNIFDIDIKELGNKYNPNKSDPIKWVFKAHPDNKTLINYFKSWFTMFIRHPNVYFDATLNNTYGYFGPGIMNSIEEGVGIFEIEDNKRINTGYFNIHFYETTKPVRTFIKDLSINLGNINILNLIYYCFTYTWILVFITIYLITKKKKDLLIFMIPLYVTLFTCMISPLNAHIRYLMPVVVSIIPALAFLEYEIRKSKFDKQL